MQLRQYEEELAERDVHVVVVTFEAGPVALAYVRETELPWPLLVDADRALYAAYGMARGKWRKILGPAALWSYLTLLLRGRKLRPSGDDVLQLGGDVLIDPQGIVRIHHVSSNPADRPDVATLLDAASG